jgi:hypothetical protein
MVIDGIKFPKMFARTVAVKGLSTFHEGLLLHGVISLVGANILVDLFFN